MKQGRFGELDALRGFAAFCVVIFHFTVRAQREGFPLFEFSFGQHGVQLFFCISGFVIYWTLGRSKTLLDFAVSRFSRLYPSYWTALAFLFLVELFLVGHRPWISGYIVNISMLQHLFGWSDRDVVYWTLGVELMFYVWMAVAFVLGALDKIERLAAGWLALSAALGLASKILPLPEIVRTVLVFEHASFFIGGILFYRCHHDGWTRERTLLLLFAVAVNATLNGLYGACVSLVVFGIFAFAICGRLRWIVNPLTVWLGGISYSLYLTHREFGEWMMIDLVGAGFSRTIAFTSAVCASLMLATLITRIVERPVMKKIRDFHLRTIERRSAN